jgi:hypothetical protein
LANDPQLRTSFQEMYDALASDTTDFTRNNALLGGSMWIKDYLREFVLLYIALGLSSL